VYANKSYLIDVDPQDSIDIPFLKFKILENTLHLDRVGECKYDSKWKSFGNSYDEQRNTDGHVVNHVL